MTNKPPSFRELMQKKRREDSMRCLRADDSVRNLKAHEHEFDEFDEASDETSIGSCLGSTNKNAAAIAEEYEYEDTEEDLVDYGYEDAAPSPKKSLYNRRRRGSNSSFKSCGSYGSQGSFARRGSCASQESFTRRSSLTGEGGVVVKALRRMSMPTERVRRSSLSQFKSSSMQRLSCNLAAPRRSSLKSGSGRRSSIGYSGEVEVALRDGQRVRRRTSICFDEMVDEVEVDDVAKIASKDDLWFQDEDYQRIHDKNMELLHKASFESPAAGKKYCVRGLESLMAPDQVDIRKQSARHAVLSEQYFQEQDSQYSDDQIATLYRSSARDSCSEAAKRAAQDAKEVESYLRSSRLPM